MSALNRKRVAWGLLITALFVGSALSSDEKIGTDYEVQRAKDNISVITTDALGGDQRYLLYVSLDKPVYRVTEPVFVRTTILNASDNTPLSSGSADIRLQIKGPKGNVVLDTYAQGDDSTVGAKWTIPAGTSGGRYTALVTSQSLGAPQSERTFEIRAYRAPRLKTQIEFTRDGYGPGDEVQASIKVDRAEGGVPLDAKVTVIARVDGNEVYRKSGYQLAENGVLSTQFPLPSRIEVGEGSLAFVIEDGGVVETASKTLPIILQTVSVKFYPESGELVAGLKSRVYVQANRPDGKPADIRGRIFSLRESVIQGKVVAELATLHEGRGVFSLVPKKGEKYALVIDAPSGFSTHFELPEVKARGTVLESTQAVYAYDADISVGVTSIGADLVGSVTLFKRDQLLDTQAVSSDGEIVLNAKDAEGVLMVTAWSTRGVPLAERLIYRQPKFAVNVSLSVSEGQYVPGDDVSVDILTTDENGKPIEAVVGLTVTDDAVLEIVEKREQAPRLPVMVYLENEVSDLADAHVYLDANNEQAPQAVDLLLGTQGWRRFVLVNYQELKQEQPELVMRALAERIAPVVKFNQLVLEEVVVAGVRQNRRVFNQRGQVPVAMAQAELADQPIVDQDIVAEQQVVEKPALNLRKLEAEQDFRLEPIQAKAKREDENAFAPRQYTVVREYAHTVRENRKANDRVDFTETLYWHKGIRTSARDGKATIKFGLSDSVSSFRVSGDAFGRNGALGAGDTLISSVEPFYIEPKMPLEVSVGDVIELPVAMVNASDQEFDVANLLVKGEGLKISQAKATSLSAGARIRRVVRIVADKPGEFPLVLSAAAGPFTDRVTRMLTVKPRGFPVSVAYGGLLSPQTEFATDIVIPDAIEAGSLVTIAKVYPSPLANMEEALNALLRRPNGCFEQTSSSNYPLVMAQQYFISHQGVDPEKIAKAKNLLDQGYKKLIGFESKDKGYEWFGANPAHEALTAYGLMQFVDMAKIMPVDDTMIKRTRRWLLDRRDGDGGFKRNSKALDSFGSAPPTTTNAYIVWSLLESGESPSTLKKEIAAVKAQAYKTDDSYIIALAANVLYLAGDPSGARKLSQKLADMVGDSGAVANAKTSITRSGGDSLMIETTSLALLAWLKEDTRWAAQVETSMKWLFERSQSGRFGSTQSTILALKAINTYDAARAQPKKAGTIQLLVNGREFGKPVSFNKASKGAIELPDFSAALTPGEHTLALRMNDGSKMPFAVEISYNTPLPLSNDESLISLETSMSTNRLAEGELLEMHVSVTVGDKVAPTPMAIVGVPAGLDVRHDQLKELVGANTISSYEVKGREIIFYWRALQANETRTFPVSLVANVPGQFTGPASRGYLYYTDEHKHWVTGHKVTVVAISAQD